MRLLLLCLSLVALSPGCHASKTVVAATATIAVVETIDAGVAAFNDWAVADERALGQEILAACQGKYAAQYDSCVATIKAPRRDRVDKVRAAIGVYRGALSLSAAGVGDTAKIASAGADLTRALASVGILIGAGVQK